MHLLCSLFFFFNDTATTEIYTLSLHDALPISFLGRRSRRVAATYSAVGMKRQKRMGWKPSLSKTSTSLITRCSFSSFAPLDRKSTRLNSSHSQISYAVFCLKKKKKARHYLVVYYQGSQIHHSHGGS